MWGRTGKRPSADKEVATNNPLALRWGSERTFYLSDGLDQGNNIAVFPTKVQGAAAQFDLWKTSKNYHNRNLADALHTWSGGNETESYIAFVTKRVPGLTRFTNMNDTFLSSPQGLAFMKAQAWHEAGKEYPMSDAEWRQAQSLVFSHVNPMPQPPPKAPQPVPVSKPSGWAAFFMAILSIFRGKK